MTWALVDGGRKAKWVARRDLAKASRTALELSAMPDGTCLRFELPGGLRVVAHKTNERRWQLHGGGIAVDVLSGLAAVEMVKRDA